MRKTNKFLAASLAASMVFSMGSMCAFADEASVVSGNSIVINAADGYTFADTTVFTAYKLFDVQVVGDTTDANDKDYIYTVTEGFAGLFEAGQDPYKVVSEKTAAQIKEFAASAYTYASTNSIEGTAGAKTSDSKYTISDLTSGYYLIYQNVNAADSKPILVTFIELTDGTAEVTMKGSATLDLTKEILHDDDAEDADESDGWGVYGDNAIGENISYRITADIPDVTDFTTYDYIIHDYAEAGLTLNDTSFVVKAGETTLTSTQYTVKTSGFAATHASAEASFGSEIFEIVVPIETLTALNTAGATTLTVEYTMQLNANAELAVSGDIQHNDNTAWLTYTAQPNSDLTKDTAPKTVIDYTFTFNLLKKASDKIAEEGCLAGATFNVKKGDTVLNFVQMPVVDNVYDKYVLVAAGTEGAVTDIVTTENKIVFVGLDDNTTYTLVEKEAPAGYDKIADYDFTIDCDGESNDNMTKITTFKVSDPASTVTDVTVEGTTIKAIDTLKTFSPLPATGGVGTTIFYVVGILLMGGAAVLLISKKKVNSEE